MAKNKKVRTGVTRRSTAATHQLDWERVFWNEIKIAARPENHSPKFGLDRLDV